jgi:hypothetical protein
MRTHSVVSRAAPLKNLDGRNRYSTCGSLYRRDCIAALVATPLSWDNSVRPVALRPRLSASLLLALPRIFGMQSV